MPCVAPSDEAVVEKARRLVEGKQRIRWLMLSYAVIFLGFAGYCTVLGIRKVEDMDQLSLGFVFGLTLAVVWTSFGLLGAVCLGKFLVGVRGDFRAEDLLVRYHDRLRDLGQLPKENGRRTGRSSERETLIRPEPYRKP